MNAGLVRDIFYLGGVAAVFSGTAAYDWRVGLVVLGCILLGTAALAVPIRPRRREKK